MGIKDADKVMEGTQTVAEVTDEMDLDEEAEFDIFEFLANSPHAYIFDSSLDEKGGDSE